MRYFEAALAGGWPKILHIRHWFAEKMGEPRQRCFRGAGHVGRQIVCRLLEDEGMEILFVVRLYIWISD